MSNIHITIRTEGCSPANIQATLLALYDWIDPFAKASEYTLCSECNEFVALNADGWNFDHQCREYQPDWDLIGKERDYDC